jgi:hypothetical protein
VFKLCAEPLTEHRTFTVLHKIFSLFHENRRRHKIMRRNN